ncbi:hypothetical protein [Micromonospora sp. WMMD1274]|uniref:hypothetical protein n=1 Tax=Micromonospora sp. WMMD1274 TaxID=3404116 RepID=UPI003B95D7C7
MPTPTDRPRRPSEDAVSFCVATGRITAAQGEQWRAQLDQGVMRPQTVEILASALAPGCAVPVTAAGQLVHASTPGSTQGGAAAGGRTRPGNPLVEHLAAAAPTEYHAACQVRPAPTLFEGGDLPAFTASGIDPAMLARVPWQARHAIAATPDRARAAAMIEDMSGEEAETLAQLYHGSDAANRDYVLRVQQWRSDGLAAAARRAEQQRKPVHASAGRSVADMSDEECYDATFGPIDRQRDDRRDAAERAILEGRAVGHGRDVRQIRAARGEV